MRLVLAGDSLLTETSPSQTVTKLGPRLRALGFDVVTVAEGGANSSDVVHQQVPDQIVGQDRRVLLRGGIDAASARGDAQVVVVSGADDVELAEVSASLGFHRVVDLIGSPRS